MAGKISADEIPPEVLARAMAKAGMGKPPRKAPTRSMTMHEVRTYAIRVLNVMADLTDTERARVLRHATKVNEV